MAKCIIKSLLIHILVLLYTCEISPKYRCTYKYRNSQAALTHFLGCTVDKGTPQCIPLWSVTATAMSEGSSFKSQSSRYMCAMAIGSCLQGLGSFSRAPLSATRTWIRNLPDWAAATRTKWGKRLRPTCFWNVIGSPQTSKDKAKMAPQIGATPASHVPREDYFSFTVLSKLRRMLPLRLYRKQLIIVLIKVTNECCGVLLAYFLSTYEILGLQKPLLSPLKCSKNETLGYLSLMCFDSQ